MLASRLTHEVGHYLAHGGSKDEVLEDAGDEGEGHAEDGHHQVADGERQQEGVGHGAHALVDRQHHDDQQVAEHTQNEDERVEQDPQCVVVIWCRRRQGAEVTGYTWLPCSATSCVLHDNQVFGSPNQVQSGD